MPLRRKSPRKNHGMRPGYYGTTDQDSPVITRGKASAKPPSKKRSRIGYKEPQKKLHAPAMKIYTESSSDSLEYEEESESDDEDKGLVIDISNKNERWWQLYQTGEDKESRKPTMMRILMMLTLKWVVQNYQSQLYERVYSMMKSMTMMKAKTTMKTVTVAHHGCMKGGKKMMRSPC